MHFVVLITSLLDQKGKLRLTNKGMLKYFQCLKSFFYLFSTALMLDNGLYKGSSEPSKTYNSKILTGDIGKK